MRTGEPNELRYAREYIKLAVDQSHGIYRATWHLPCELNHRELIHPKCMGHLERDCEVVAVVMAHEPPQPFCKNCEKLTK